MRSKSPKKAVKDAAQAVKKAAKDAAKQALAPFQAVKKAAKEVAKGLSGGENQMRTIPVTVGRERFYIRSRSLSVGRDFIYGPGRCR
jgi:hypothetical protein